MKEITSDPRERALYEAALRYESDKASMIAESIEKGILKGREEGRYETAKELYKMKMEDNLIMRAAKISREELEKLKNEVKES